MNAIALSEASLRSFAAGALLCLFLSVAAPGADAHDMWIEPSEFRAAGDSVVRLSLRLGEHGRSVEPVPRDGRRIARFEGLGPAGAIRLPGLDGHDPAGVLRLREAGRHAVVYVTHPALVELPPAAFRDYLLEEGLERILDERREFGESDLPARELYRRSLKALIGAGGPVMNDDPVGLPLELVVEWDALERRTAAGAERRPKGVRLLWDGEPVAGALVRARRLGERETAMTGRTDAAGRVAFAFGPGRWVVHTVTMERSEDPRAEWESTWSSLSFEVGGPTGEREDAE